ncbi:MAG TPA: chromate transporter [Vicinamibacterales bacterium]|nr:chromate transporter [Vicinamibacterales bacterium]
MRDAPSLATLAWLVTRDANKTIGSGMASIELLRRTLERRGWIDDREHGVLNAVARFTPGTNVLAYLAALGWSFHGAAGAVVAVLGGSLPGSVIVTILTAAAATLDRWRVVRVALTVATLVAAGLVLANAWSLVRPHVRGARVGWALASAALAAALYLAGATPVRVLLVLAIWGSLTPSEATPQTEKHVAPPR